MATVMNRINTPVAKMEGVRVEVTFDDGETTHMTLGPGVLVQDALEARGDTRRFTSKFVGLGAM
jgi:hypothetical protein